MILAPAVDDADAITSAIFELDDTLSFAVEIATMVREDIVAQGVGAHRDDEPAIALALGALARAAKLVAEMKGRRRT